jgi:hypothetical protein
VNNWPVLRENTKEKIHREIREAISEDLVGDSKTDVPIWNKVLQLHI